jgi:hypothetical protein
LKTAATQIAKFCPDLEAIRANFIESDSLAVIYRRANSPAWVPVHIREDGEFVVWVDEEWHALNALPARIGTFQRFEKARTKKLYDTARDRLVEV